MDFYHQPSQQPASRYEIVAIKKVTFNTIQQSKFAAFDFMDQLDGWCTKNKASVLIDLVFLLKPQTVVEIGVWGGKSLIPMACALKLNEKGKIYGIDPWSKAESIKGMEGIHYDWWSAADHEPILKVLQEKIIAFNLQNQIELIRSSSEHAFPIPNIDILHIDGNHSEQASNLDVNKWVPLVRRGGVIIFDDLSWGTNINAVRWLDENCIRLAQFTQDYDDWGIWIKP